MGRGTTKWWRGYSGLFVITDVWNLTLPPVLRTYSPKGENSPFGGGAAQPGGGLNQKGNTMKRFILTLTAIFICTCSYAETINLHWLNDNGTTYTESTCTVNDDLIIPTTPPTKYGYTFTGWEMCPFVQIEYLESTGTQYIDTGYIQSSNTHYKWKGIDYTTSDASLFGTQQAGVTSCLLYGTRYNRSLYAGNNYINTLYSSTEERPIEWQLICNNGTAILKKADTTINSLNYAGSPTTDTMYIYGIHYNGSIGSKSSLKLYYFQIYDNDVLVRDFIPVLDPNGVPCMYDKVEEKFYYNAGTGDFIAGPVIGE